MKAVKLSNKTYDLLLSLKPTELSIESYIAQLIQDAQPSERELRRERWLKASGLTLDQICGRCYMHTSPQVVELKQINYVDYCASRMGGMTVHEARRLFKKLNLSETMLGCLNCGRPAMFNNTKDLFDLLWFTQSQEELERSAASEAAGSHPQ